MFQENTIKKMRSGDIKQEEREDNAAFNMYG